MTDPEALLANELGTPEQRLAAAKARLIARFEIASFCGLVLRRLQDTPPGMPLAVLDLKAIFGEALADFGGDTGQPGEAT